MAKIKKFFSLSTKTSFFWLFFFVLLSCQSFFWQDFSLFSLGLNFFLGPLLLLWWLRSFWLKPGKNLEKNWTFLTISLIVTSTFQALLGIYQFIFQHSLAGYFFLGEPDLAQPGITSSSWFGTLVKLPYGTTPHPNILAAWLCLGIVLTISLIQSRKIGYRLGSLLAVLYLLALVLTQSWTAWLSLPLLFVFCSRGFSSAWQKIWQKMSGRRKRITVLGMIILLFLLSLLIPLALIKFPFFSPTPLGINETSITRRSDLELTGLRSVASQPGGIGLQQQFRLIYSRENRYVGERFLQPVHNSGLFLVISLGLWIIIMFIIYLYTEYNLYSIYFWAFLLISPIFSLDHYITSTISGQYIAIMIWIFFVISHGYDET